MTIQTPSIYNAAQAGMLAGLMSRPNTDATAGDYAAYANAANTFAAALDASVGADTTLETGNASIVPGSAAQANAAETRPLAMALACMGYWSGRDITHVVATDTAAGTYAAAVAAIKAIYTQLLTVFSNA